MAGRRLTSKSACMRRPSAGPGVRAREQGSSARLCTGSAVYRVLRTAARSLTHSRSLQRAGTKSFGCALAKAAASGQVTATISAIAEAAALAVNKCPDCDPVAETFNWAELIIKLDAEAEAAVKVALCVGPRSTASIEAYIVCKAHVYAKGYAEVRLCVWDSCG